MTATMRPTPEKMSEPTLSPRERLQRGVQLRTLDVTTKRMGRFRVRELRQAEIEEVNEPLMKRNIDAEGKVTATTDSRGHHARAIAYALINDDGSNVYPDPLGEGVREIGQLPTDVVEELWKAVDELNVLSGKEKQKLGKDSEPTRTSGGG